MALSKPRRIAVLCLPGIGDALMATPLIRLLKQREPEAEIDVISMFGGVEYVMKTNPYVSRVYKVSLYGGNAWQGLRQLLALRRNRYGLSILAFPAYRGAYHLVHWLVGARMRIAHRFPTGYLRELNFLENRHVPVDESLHNVENNLNLLRPLGIDWQAEARRPISYDLELPEADREFGRTYLKDLGWKGEGTVGFHPGSTNSPVAVLRRWPAERYAELASLLIKKGRKVLVFVGPDEVELGDEIEKQVGGTESLRVVRGVSFGQSLGILALVQALVCNDNGFGHLASGLGVRTVSLCGPTDDRWSRPYDLRYVQVVRPPGMRPWYRFDLKWSVPKEARSGMEGISVDAVLQVLADPPGQEDR